MNVQPVPNDMTRTEWDKLPQAEKWAYIDKWLKQADEVRRAIIATGYIPAVKMTLELIDEHQMPLADGITYVVGLESQHGASGSILFRYINEAFRSDGEFMVELETWWNDRIGLPPNRRDD